ncbi:MAG: hypothetical protein LBE71_00595, partial [Dysgonamonadaceae bacterium]|nr:hypothetical protein [Dysgonamonadaceae bacterium]
MNPPRHCEGGKPEAIHVFFLDCFASLAMTLFSGLPRRFAARNDEVRGVTGRSGKPLNHIKRTEKITGWFDRYGTLTGLRSRVCLYQEDTQF